MSYALFWVEALLTSLLWTATLIACIARVRRKWISRLGIVLIVLVPLLLFGAAAAGTGFLKFHLEIEQNRFGYALSLLLAYCIGASVLLLRAGRRTEATHRSSASIWPRGRLSLGLLTAAAVTSMTLWNMDLEIRSHAESLQNEAGAIMLSASPPTVSDERNAAFVYQKAFARLAADSKALHGPDSPLYDDPPDEKHPATPDLLKRHEVTIKLLLRAATMPDCRFDHDYAHPRVSTLLPELNKIRTAADLLWLHSRYEQSQDHIRSAIADVNAIFRLSRSVGDESFLVTLLVSGGWDGHATEALEYVLPDVTNKDQLADLDIGDATFNSRMIQRALQGEEAMGFCSFSDLASGRMSLSNTMAIMNTNGSKRQFQTLDVQPLPMLIRVFLMPDDVAAYRQLCEENQHQAAQPYYKMEPHFEPPGSFPHTGLVTSILAHFVPKDMLFATQAQARHACAQVAVAMTRYRLDHGGFPTSLDLLVPNYLDEVPQDPFDGKPLRLVQKGDEWIIYSVGPDAKDDGGAPYDSKTKTGDLPFVLKIRK